jgi:hypothetical protein
VSSLANGVIFVKNIFLPIYTVKLTQRTIEKGSCGLKRPMYEKGMAGAVDKAKKVNLIALVYPWFS